METIEYPLLSFACEFGDLTAIDCKIAFPHQLLAASRTIRTASRLI
jgi:hypothetical protein